MPFVKDYSAVQGPCPSGFHIPSKDENVALVAAMTTLGIDTSNGNCMKTYMKMPFAGYRNRSDAGVSYHGTNAFYWSYTAHSYPYAYRLYFNSAELSPKSYNFRSLGISVRCFKNTPTIPTSSWITLFDGSSVATGAGIFHNTTDGLISISSDGQTWITIQDKNLGATTVYNDGDTLSEANCGLYFQWGNNYGFPFTGTVTTSSTKVDASNYGPGNYYSSSTFITVSASPYDWSSVQNDNLWGGVTGVQQRPAKIIKRYYGGKLVDDYSAVQGPCPEGFHVPSADEWASLFGILTSTFGMANNSTTIETYLKMAMAGRRVRSSSNQSNLGSIGYYWSNSASSSTTAYRLYFGSSSISYQGTEYRSNGFTIRAFKDISVVPTSAWTTLYDGSVIAQGAGVFHNITDGLISISGDGINWTTIVDKNLGATTVFDSGDTLSEANCGYYYQWGNNYGFAFSGTLSDTSTTQVNTTNYGPGNYYSSNTFIIGNNDWSSVKNDNLWGGVTGIQQRPAKIIKRYYGGKLVDDYSAMQGPCPEGFHVPMRSEWDTIKTIWTTLGGGGTDGPNFGNSLKLPRSGGRGYSDSDTVNQGSHGLYWSCIHSTSTFSYYLAFSSSSINISSGRRAAGYTIRCFKNSPIIPTSSWTKLYGTSIETGGIFWSSTDGLISISSDGQTWITIADKNLGATTVYNDGDTLSEANCGKYYQWGNNYGFPRTGTITNQSTTQVDASNYGPLNYYSSDTFIKYNGSWDSSNNKNLRGGETGVQRKPIEITESYYPGNPKLDPPVISLTTGIESLVINWEDPANKTGVSWDRSVLVRSTTRVPTSISDGTTLVTSTTRDQYKTTGYTDSGLTAGTTYYYNVFAVGNNDEVTGGVGVSGIPLSAPTLEYILVGGGGAGGRARCRAGGGGGAGGLVYCEAEILSIGANCCVVIGSGGVGGAACYNGAYKGGDSCFGTIVAYGGGGGGGMCSYSRGCPGTTGGSGGGGAGCNTACAAGCTGQGNRGGAGCATRGGGGGGACTAGCNAACGGNYYGGDGGCGCIFDISGVSTVYAGGGGGGGCTGRSAAQGGGCGGCYRTAGCPATTYGSGGGGAGCTASNICCIAGGNGCQGVFIARYPANCGYNISGGCKYECNGYCIHCFTQDGTLTVN